MKVYENIPQLKEVDTNAVIPTTTIAYSYCVLLTVVTICSKIYFIHHKKENWMGILVLVRTLFRTEILLLSVFVFVGVTYLLNS